MNCNLNNSLFLFKKIKYTIIIIINIFLSGVNSTIQQHESKMIDNNVKMQESIINTMNKYNEEVNIF